MTKIATRSTFIIRFFSGCAVLSCIVQWTWTLLILAYPFLHSDFGKLFLPPKPTEPQPIIRPIHLPSFIELIIIIAVVAIVLIVCVIVVIWAPREISRAAEKTTQSTAQTIVPLITHRQSISATRRHQLTGRIVWWIKFTLIFLPFSLLLLSLLFSSPIDARITLIFGALLLLATLFWSGLALLLNRLSPRRARL